MEESEGVNANAMKKGTTEEGIGKISKTQRRKQRRLENKQRELENAHKQPQTTYHNQQNIHKELENKHQEFGNKHQNPETTYHNQQNTELENKQQEFENKHQKPEATYNELENKQQLEKIQKSQETTYQHQENTNKSRRNKQHKPDDMHKDLENKQQLENIHENPGNKCQLPENIDRNLETTHEELENVAKNQDNKHQMEQDPGHNTETPQRTKDQNTQTGTEENTPGSTQRHRRATETPKSDRIDCRRLRQKERERIDWKFKYDFCRFYNTHLEFTGDKNDEVSQKEVTYSFKNFCITHGSRIPLDSLRNIPKRVTKLLSSFGVNLKRISNQGYFYEGIRYYEKDTTSSANRNRSTANPKDAAKALKDMKRTPTQRTDKARKRILNIVKGTSSDMPQESRPQLSSTFNQRLPNQLPTLYRLPIPKATKDNLPINLTSPHLPLPPHHFAPSTTSNHFTYPPQYTIPSTSQTTISYHPVPHLTTLPHHITPISSYPNPNVPSCRPSIPPNILPHHNRSLKPPDSKQFYKPIPSTSHSYLPHHAKTSRTKPSPNKPTYNPQPTSEPQPQTSRTQDESLSFPNPSQPYHQASQQPLDPRTQNRHNPNQCQINPQFFTPTISPNSNVLCTLTHLPSRPQLPWLTPLPQDSNSPLFIPSFTAVPPQLTPIQYLNTPSTVNTPLPCNYFTPPQTLFPTDANLSFHSPYFPHIPPVLTPLPGPIEDSPLDCINTPPSAQP